MERRALCQYLSVVHSKHCTCQTLLSILARIREYIFSPFLRIQAR